MQLLQVLSSVGKQALVECHACLKSQLCSHVEIMPFFQWLLWGRGRCGSWFNGCCGLVPDKGSSKLQFYILVCLHHPAVFELLQPHRVRVECTHGHSMSHPRHSTSHLWRENNGLWPSWLQLRRNMLPATKLGWPVT